MKPPLSGRMLLALLGVSSLLACASGPRGSQPPGPSPACGDPATPIHDIQGAGQTSPLLGEVVAVEAIVIGDFQESSELNGFFLQEEDGEADDDPTTSEGLFVFESASEVPVAVGDRVRVVGRVVEFPSDAEAPTTQLGEITTVTVCARALPLPTATAVRLPLPQSQQDLERLEGMRVRFPQQLVVTDTRQLGTYGELMLWFDAEGSLPFSATERAAPGSEAQRELESLYERSRILLDDGSTARDPDPVPWIPDVETKTLRRGTTLRDLEGVLGSGFGSYRVQPTASPTFQPAARPALPEVEGHLRVVALNLLNFFTTIDDGLNGARGADSPLELDRQRAKLVATLCSLDADIVALNELENNGDWGDNSALATLQAAVESACSPGLGRIDTGVTGVGGSEEPDSITVGLLYRRSAVEPVASPAILETGTFDGLSRPPVAQTFRTLNDADGLPFTVVVNHFKSKGCGDATGDDLDQGDGQGCYNAARIASARQLLDWLASNPSGSGTNQVLIIGDLNAHSQEDPIRLLREAGWIDLLGTRLDPSLRYSFVFGGRAGLLDHAFASPSLAERVVAATVWHVNADEPRALDYRDAIEDSSTSPDRLNRDESLYAPDPFRASDHDPVLIGLSVGSPGEG